MRKGWRRRGDWEGDVIYITSRFETVSLLGARYIVVRTPSRICALSALPVGPTRNPPAAHLPPTCRPPPCTSPPVSKQATATNVRATTAAIGKERRVSEGVLDGAIGNGNGTAQAADDAANFIYA